MSDKTPQAVQACHELLGWLIPHLDRLSQLRGGHRVGAD